jgi:hypothetical protein
MNEVPKESNVDFFLTVFEPMPMRIALYVCAIVLPCIVTFGPTYALSNMAFMLFIFPLASWWAFIAYPILFISFYAYGFKSSSHWCLLFPLLTMGFVCYQFSVLWTK